MRNNWIGNTDKRQAIYKAMLAEFKELEKAGLLNSAVRKALGERFVSLTNHCAKIETQFLEG